MLASDSIQWRTKIIVKSFPICFMLISNLLKYPFRDYIYIYINFPFRDNIYIYIYIYTPYN